MRLEPGDKLAATVGVCIAVAFLAAPEPPARGLAKPKTVTLHLFSVPRYEQLYDHDGTELPISDSTGLYAGERYIFVSDDYTGSHRRHTQRITGSDHVDCAIVNTDQGLCSVRVIIGRSALRGDRFPLNFNHRVTRLHITGGTGRYRRARGTMTANTPSMTRPGTDLTIRVTGPARKK